MPFFYYSEFTQDILQYLEFNDWSLKSFDSKDAEYVRRGIRERIRQCSVTFVYISDKTADSKWVNWEIRESIALGKGVAAMYKGGRPLSRLPKAVSENKVPVVPWNQKALGEALRTQGAEEKVDCTLKRADQHQEI